MKKSQLEIIGLLIIIVIIIFIALVFIRFMIKPSSTSLSEMRTNIQVSNLLSAIQKTSINNMKVHDLIADCSTNSASCNILKQEIPIIIAKVLSEKQKYEFAAYKNNDNNPFFIINSGSCINALSANFPFKKVNDKYDLILKLC